MTAAMLSRKVCNELSSVHMYHIAEGGGATPYHEPTHYSGQSDAAPLGPF